MDTASIAALLEEIATLLELSGDNPFKVNAHRKAARVLEGLDEDLKLIAKEGRLEQLPGIGKALAEKIAEAVETGKISEHQQLKKQLPKGLLEMLEIPGLGAKKIARLHEELGITSLAKLKHACSNGQVAKLKGFGVKTEANILDGLNHLQAYKRRRLWWEAMQVAQGLLEGLRELKAVKKAEIAGGLRRRKETVHDIDLLVASKEPDAVLDWFTSHPNMARVLAHGDTKASIRLDDGVQVDLRVVPPEQWAFALVYFTGSKEHNVRLRSRAKERGWTLNEYEMEGLKPSAKITEADLYKALDLDYIEPELREDSGEIEAAEAGALPQLVREEDIRGVFHNHTTESDGRSTLEEMAAAAASYGWDYLGIADHSKFSVQANGLDEERVLRQLEEIRSYNASKQRKIRLFAGIECDILSDGSLDLDDEVLEALDYVVISVHSRFKQDEAEMTARIIKAIEHPASTMLGHMSGRLLLKREPYAFNAGKIIDAAIANNVIIEINGNPMRLDMDWRLWHRASEKGLLTSINPDAHSTEGLQFFKSGVNVARKGWLEPKHVFNTWTLKEVCDYLNLP